MLHDSKTWRVTTENKTVVHCAEMRMISCMFCMKIKLSVELTQWLKTENKITVFRC